MINLTSCYQYEQEQIDAILKYAKEETCGQCLFGILFDCPVKPSVTRVIVGDVYVCAEVAFEDDHRLAYMYADGVTGPYKPSDLGFGKEDIPYGFNSTDAWDEVQRVRNLS